MNTNKEFVPYQPSLDMKEIGFNEPCFATYDEDKNFELQDFFQTYETFPSHIVAAPTYSQAFRWFREKYVLFHKIDPSVSRDISYSIYSNDEEIYADSCYWNYEEAELACLKKLIEMVGILENRNLRPS